MVYIHGGSYINGGPAEYPGNDEFVKRGDVDLSFWISVSIRHVRVNIYWQKYSSWTVLVSIQYRLGIFGFFSYEQNNEVFGNFGIQDQILSLKWVQENIETFGGDSKNVTIFGESAGSFSVDTLVRKKFKLFLFYMVNRYCSKNDETKSMYFIIRLNL